MVLAAVVYAYATLRRGFFELDAKAFLGAAGSSFLMGAVVYFALSFFHTFLFELAMLPVVVVVGGVVYLGALRALRLLRKDDLDFIRDIVPVRAHFLVAIVAKIAGVK